jgi:hypothetical protein
LSEPSPNRNDPKIAEVLLVATASPRFLKDVESDYSYDVPSTSKLLRPPSQPPAAMAGALSVAASV